jgi:glyoxylase-like metal-dependent hydrolase (beta-lactamase superfamily II)
VAEDQLRVAVVVSAPFDENSYIAHLADRSDCIVVDPGTDPEGICAYIDQHKLQPAAILITHGHGDHIAGNSALKTRWPDCPLVIGRNEADKLADAHLNLSEAIGVPVTSPPADVLLDAGQTYDVAGFSFEVQEIPGHSSGHIVFIWREHQPPIVFGGDILFSGSIGRADFPGGSFETLAAGIHEHLFTLPDETVVLSGHGPATTIGREKQSNPYVGRPAGWDG